MVSRSSFSRGSELLKEWRGERLQVDVCDLFEIAAETYNRFENGKRKPSGHAAFTIEKITDGAVPATSWYEPAQKPPRRKRAKRDSGPSSTRGA